jgi:hypothetical protein
VVVDTRLVGRTQKSGCFFEGCAGYGEEAATITPAMVDKFEGEPGFDLVLDGPVRIYDVREVRGVPAPFEDRPDPGLPGAWVPWQAGVTALLLLVGVALRRNLLHFRRFQAGAAWRFALVLPVAMVLGAIGVPLSFTPLAGSIAGAALLYVLLRLSTNPERLPSTRTAESWLWGSLVGALLLASVALALWSAYHGLMEGTPLPAPLAGGAS